MLRKGHLIETSSRLNVPSLFIAVSVFGHLHPTSEQFPVFPTF